jgi:hypothetical protein
VNKSASADRGKRASHQPDRVPSATEPTARALAAPDFSGAARAAAALEIATVRFSSFSALTSYGAFETLPSDVTVKVGFTRPKVESAGTRVAISSTLLLRVLPTDGPPAVDLRATAELIYVRKAETTIADADIEEFALLNAPFNAWAYWREFVQSSLARLNLPTLAIPLFRISDAAHLMLTEEDK